MARRPAVRGARWAPTIEVAVAVEALRRVACIEHLFALLLPTGEDESLRVHSGGWLRFGCRWSDIASPR